jgi:thymidylate synthase (FAD)
MRIITEPSVYLVGFQETGFEELEQFLHSERVPDWQTDTGSEAERLVEIAGRLCYMSFAKPRPGGNKAYIDHILEVGHGSVLEHAVFSLLITGVSRSLTHELVRHRAGFGFSQLSQRYVDESECAFVLPPGIKEGGSAYDSWRAALSWQQGKYVALEETLLYNEFANIDNPTLRRKKAREAARSVLPNCTETKIFVTGNARAWRHFIELRGSIHADAEMQRLAVAVMKKLQDAAPNIFGDYEVTQEGVTTPFRKV